MGDMITFARPDGKDCPGYLATPKEGDSAPGLVLVQEWWGLNDQMKRMADRLAEQGYRVLVPDLFRGEIAQDANEAQHKMEGLNFLDACDQDIAGCVAHLRKSSSKVALSGFCMGGALTILGAVRLDSLDCAVCFYGIPPAEAANPSKIAIPLLCHFANTDDWCTPAAVDELEMKLKDGHVSFDLHRYDAKHGFMRDGSEVHDAPSAERAMERTLTFLAKYLK